ncbi:MAG: MotE family protein [Bosea sp. (in: a-proteobacteria)]
MIDRQRLIPAVILGAMGLLALKAISWSGVGDHFTFTPLSDQVAPRSAVVGTDGTYNPNDFKGVNQIWARAREPYVINAPDTTGSVPAKDPKSANDGKTSDGKPGTVEPTTQPVPGEGAIRDRSGVMNQGQRAMSPAERALVERLGERREQIDARQRELDLREKLLETAERKLDGRVGELKAVEEKLDAKKDDKEGSEAQGLKKLIVMYENMKPKDAARVFDRLPSDVLVPMVLQMNPRKMSEVMAAMSPEAAEKLTVALSNRARAARGESATQMPANMPTTELQAIPQAAPVRPARRP